MARGSPAAGGFRRAAAFAAALLLSSCQMVFTWPALAPLAPPADLPADLSAEELAATGRAALENGDADLARAVLPRYLECLPGMAGDDLASAQALCIDLATLETGISAAMTGAMPALAGASEGSFTEAQLQALEDAQLSVVADDAALAAFALFSAIGPGVADPVDYCFAGAALSLHSLGGKAPGDLSTAELDAVHADADYLAGQALLAQGITLITDSGHDPSSLGILFLMAEF